mmetsp:Transcript_57784/g.118257  ORF Transcript_57784/g.118257 Transcript_57784/m.118257 type:complete len:208 (+) Transcript_57784:286-909(+)|eukprot:CAMPEP_0181328296 /NCGR_PEP_ID=MMETSP1101-20121128/22623_1 /TAXON_ID=46948 /ORGANISM="Rhodomonas abbreviata, Strain Caron Lab Isolate" /LENGTH=207 /DNA_ID=CAMNT_0023437141 /DNA_START=284 /DNA_END=907 /DNA_ORIENTATION=+
MSQDEPYQAMERDTGTASNLFGSHDLVALARKYAVMLTLAMWIVPLLPLVAEWATHPVAFAVHMAIATAMGVIELPFCCTSLRVCRRMQPVLAPFETYWLRSLLYLCFAICIGLVNWYLDKGKNVTSWVFSVLLGLLSLLFLLAYLNGERSSQAWEEHDEESGGGSWWPKFFSSSASDNLSPDDQAKRELDLQRQALRAAMATSLRF